MPTITFSGRIKNAEGAVIFMSISGADHYSFSNKYTDDFDEPLNLGSGTFYVSVTANTDGQFTFDISGTYQSCSPEVPDDYSKAKKSSESYKLVI